ncbi:MAG TPA: FAD:protein FMN transferase [Patescibacteria group bacterium]|jgi:thiamine biosynthesis lipoprotein|nr:FAD:protein FMN transferase [Patescibacteria group bacterium]
MPKPELFEFDAIGTHWWCESLSKPISDDLQREIIQYCDQFDQAYSRFIDSSYIGILNTAKTLSSPPAELLQLFAFAKELYDVSNGAFDITVGGTLHAQGYGSRALGSQVCSDFWERAGFTREQITIPHDAVVDFGGFGKGWLIDALVAIFRAHGHSRFIINGGGDMFVEHTKPVHIALEDPADPSVSLGTIALTGGFASSSQQKREWYTADGQRKAHIIDPVTNDMAEPAVSTVFVQAPSALIADAMATILFLRPELHSALIARYDIRVLAR